MTGLAEKWVKEGRKWLFIFQDTNPLSFRALPSVLGVSKTRGFELNSITVPRKPGEAIGAICELKKQNGEAITINVEYNQLEPLMKPLGGE
jgi:UDP-sugar pyrophosphorylase